MIKLRGGFDKNCFEVRHIRRSKVVGSINGWMPIAVSDQFGGAEEVIDATTSDPFQDTVDDDDDNNTEMEAIAPPETAQIDLSSTKVRPLSKKGMSDVMSHITSYCDSCPDDAKFVVAEMLIKIKQQVMGGANNVNGVMLGESQDPVEATRHIAAQCQSAFKATSGEFMSGKVSDKPSTITASK